MTDENTATEQVNDAEPSIEDLAAQFKTTETPPPQSETKPAPEVTPPPDPVQDSDGFKRWMAEREVQRTQQLNDLVSREQAREQQAQAAAEKAEFDAAGAEIAKAANIEDADLAKAYLISQYGSDPNVKTIVDNRESNPAAFKKALGVIGERLGKTVKPVDPQLAENARAMNELHTGQSQAQPQRTSEEDKLLKMPQAEFENWWRSAQQ